MNLRIAALASFVLCLGVPMMSRASWAIDCSRPAGSLPNPELPAGTESLRIPVEHIVVIMQENRSFDSYLGRLNEFGYGDEVDGITPEMWNFDSNGKKIYAYHEKSLCSTDADHSWNGEHGSWNHGLQDSYVIQNHDNAGVMGYYEPSEIPFYYALANRFAIGDRYFASTLAPSDPNRAFLLTATAHGLVKNTNPPKGGFTQKTIFDVLQRYGVSWKYYRSLAGDYLHEYATSRHAKGHLGHVRDFTRDLARGTLPQVSFVDASGILQDEHPVADIHIGQAWVAKRIESVMHSRYWASTAIFFTYDEDGGLFDHVAPPDACEPDAIPPNLPSGSLPGHYDRYGHRVPFILVSPFAKRHYVSHVIYDHTSVLKFIETKYNLPALTGRDANADAMLDLFDFEHPDTEIPELPRARAEVGKAFSCLARHLPGYMKLLEEAITGND